MNYRINHGGYPDWCRVYTRHKSDKHPQFGGVSDDDIVVLYEGECKKYGSSQMRKFTNANVVKADYCVDIPYEVKGIEPGMLVDYNDAQESRTGIEIVTAYCDDVFHLGTTVFFNVTMN